LTTIRRFVAVRFLPVAVSGEQLLVYGDGERAAPERLLLELAGILGTVPEIGEQ